MPLLRTIVILAAAAVAAPAALAAAPALEAPAGVAVVRRDGSQWVLQARAASRAEVATALATASGSQLLEQPQVLSTTRPLTRHWRGRDLAEAWRQVLGDEVSHALQCDASRCRVWVLAAPAAGSRAPGTAAARAAGAGAATATAVDTVASPSTAGDLLEPDPPGLFPGD
ncbi:MAG: hypothetical protein KF863_05635 [Rubrivivax sp.]|nr:hypothetical protein [Rubrivivax sp.]